jgi:uncharacterized phage infection (PIP) family protein YhgE
MDGQFMGTATGFETAEVVASAQNRIERLLNGAEGQIGAVADGFESLAAQANGILALAAGIVACVEDESVNAVLPRVQLLGAAARQFIHERNLATAGILEIVGEEAKLLEKLAHLTRGQRSIARETQTLSVLTQIEVARLGQLGAGFQYLAHELDEFSQAVTQSTKELAGHAEERRVSIDETRRSLAAGLPRIQQELARIEEGMGSALAAVDSSLSALSHAPERFQECVRETAAQIDGVVAAIQSHDITRQQLEHVSGALRAIESQLREAAGADRGAAAERPKLIAGLTVQSYQLRSIQETVNRWLAQIGDCMDGILRIGTSGVLAIGPQVLEQEQALSAQLARLEKLEEECLNGSELVHGTFAGLSALMDLAGKNLEKSRYVRDRLQLLTFNSIVEANHLGSQADAILEISQSIKRVSTDWAAMTDRSGQALGEIRSLFEKASEGMQVFSSGGNAELNEARAHTRKGLGDLRATVDSAARKAAEVETATGKMRAGMAAVSSSRDRLDASFSAIGTALAEVDETRRQLEAEAPGASKRFDRREIEARYAASYTTEIEREVLRAALSGGPLPAMRQNLAGNSVELF